MTRPRFRTIALALMAAPLALGLAGCGKKDEAPTAAPSGAALPFLLTGSLAALHGTVADLPADAWTRRPAPGEWSLTEIAGASGIAAPTAYRMLTGQELPE